MQAIIGRGLITHGLDPATAFIGFGDGQAMLGPVVGPSTEVDPIAHLFVTLGKLISVRRILAPQPAGLSDTTTAANHLLTQFKGLQEVVLHYDAGSEFELIWKPLARSIKQQVVDPLTRAAVDIEQRTRRFVATETHAILSLDPTATVEEAMEGLDAYLLNRGYTVEAKSRGFRDFIANYFRNTKGEPVELPTSNNPTFPDSWITPQVVDPAEHGGSRREWSIIF